MPRVGLSKPPVTSTSWLPLLCVAHRQMLQPCRRVDKLGRVQLSTCLQVGEVVKFAVPLAAHGDVKHIYPRAPEHDEQHVRQGGGIRSYRERTGFLASGSSAHHQVKQLCHWHPDSDSDPHRAGGNGTGRRSRKSGENLGLLKFTAEAGRRIRMDIQHPGGDNGDTCIFDGNRHVWI